jgi:hypothetical protein
VDGAYEALDDKSKDLQAQLDALMATKADAASLAACAERVCIAWEGVCVGGGGTARRVFTAEVTTPQPHIRNHN